jgi:hypothetical protein
VRRGTDQIGPHFITQAAQERSTAFAPRELATRSAALAQLRAAAMGLKDRLRKLGGKLGVLQVITQPETAPGAAPAPASASGGPAKIATRSVTLDDLIGELRQTEVRALSELPAELSVSFEKVFETAGIRSEAQAWTVERLTKLLRSDAYKKLDRAAAQKVIAGLIAAEHASVEDVVRDAVARDNAIDAFEIFAKAKLDERGKLRKQKLAELDDRARDLREQMARLRQEAVHDRERWREFMARKIACEKEMAWAVGFVLDRPVVSISTPPPDEGSVE